MNRGPLAAHINYKLLKQKPNYSDHLWVSKTFYRCGLFMEVKISGIRMYTSSILELSNAAFFVEVVLL